MALGERLLTAAKPHKKDLNKGIAKVLGALTQSHTGLKDAVRDQVPLARSSETASDAIACDRRLDACWSALNDFLTAFSKLPDVPAAAEAAALKSALFPDGLKFTQLVFELEWAESEARLQRIKAQDLDKRIAKLGGQLFLDTLISAHAAYGKALGMTQVPSETAATPPNLRVAMADFTTVLRKYVAKVMGSVDDDEPDTQALADALLAPLATWNIGPTTSTQAAATQAPNPQAGGTQAGGADPKAPGGAQP
ncbi:Hypothetical protein A7982_07991 [Minicystis rosea]|nr:Hypothetical protein A7982_07991 [Minicystis rosea]